MFSSCGPRAAVAVDGRIQQTLSYHGKGYFGLPTKSVDKVVGAYVGLCANTMKFKCFFMPACFFGANLFL